MRWAAFALEQPRFAELGERLLAGPGVVLVATIRRDGTPRLSPVEPLFWQEDLWLSMGWDTRKTLDLQRDPRVLVHNVITDREGSTGEYKVRGHAVAELDPVLHENYAIEVQRTLGWNPEPGRFHLFWIDLDEVTHIRWDPATNDQFVSRWPARTELVRRGTSATSLGDPEPFSELITRDDVP